MNIRVKVSPPTNFNTFAAVQIILPGRNGSCRLRVDFGPFAHLGKPNCPELLDILLLACIVYALDRRILRSSADDNWTRSFSFTLPVDKPGAWKGIKATVDQCLSFLTGDEWDISYKRRTVDLFNVQRDNTMESLWEVGVVSLFSGGLDSLVGVIDWLEQNPKYSIVLVGHHDPRISGPYSDQNRVFNILESKYPARLNPVFTSAGADSGEETSLRSRSFLFIALGLYAAHQYSDTIPLLIPENGTMALNIPLTPSRVGSCSTRTVHPYYLSLVREMAIRLGINNPIINPLELKTKGECLSECLNQEALKLAIPYSASCAKRGHKSSWIRRSAKQCGGCIPCIYRRAALHKIGLDTEIYGRDFCRGEVKIQSTLKHADDLRAYLTFLQENYSNVELGKLLLLNGRLELPQLDVYANVIQRASNEVRELLSDKATKEIKRQAGLI
jgi:hypothetical protein